MSRHTLPGLFSETSTSPFVQSLQKEMNQMLDRFRSEHPFFQSSDTALVPAIDVAETDDAIEITADLPGVKEEDLDVSISDQVLTMKGTKSTDREEKDHDFQLVERSYGSFQRRIPLGFTPAEGAVAASFADGVLSIRVTKPEEIQAAVQKIAIGKK